MRAEPARRRHSSASDKRAAIIDAALALFGRYGFRRTSIDDLAREAGIAKGTVYLYFQTKEEIFRALSREAIDRVLRDADAASRQPGPAADRLEAILWAKFGTFHEMVHTSPHAAELIDSKGQISADLFQKADRAYLHLLAQAVGGATESGELAPERVGLTAESAAELLLSAARGIETNCATMSSRVYRQRLRSLVRMMVTGLASRRSADGDGGLNGLRAGRV